jgi:organic hydroperoxide reductase OsmC/OhrA
MQALPHHYTVTAQAAESSQQVVVATHNVAPLDTDAPIEFGGSGEHWSPEALLMAAVADCFILTFRAIAGPSRVPWSTLECSATGTLDRVERTTRFTEITLTVGLTIPEDVDAERALRLLHKAEENCLVTNSMVTEVHLNATVNKAS